MFKIAIDGPGGAGKSTVAKAVAHDLGITYVDTGALYRTIGLYCRENGIDPCDAVAVSAILPEIEITLSYEDGLQIIRLNGVDVGDSIRQHDISMYASHVSAHPAVREYLLSTQRNIAKTQSVIMDGRDIATVIFPDAEVKIFLTASAENRAQRRYDELVAKGVETTFETVLADIQTRDYNDSHRAVAPLRPAEDSVILDNTGLSAEETVNSVKQIIAKKLGSLL
jgi:cytidylate kinase